MRVIFKFLVAFILSFNIVVSSSQDFVESNLPIIIINTFENEIPDDPKVNGTMGIIYNGKNESNRINDFPNYFNGNIAIETRGNSTQDFDKRQYLLELRTESNNDTSVNLFNMGADEDWILHAMVLDKTQIRIPFSFYLSHRMGNYASEWKFVELIINDDYRGLYILTERIKRDDDRVNIAKLTPDDINGDEVTGGYILRIDWLEDPKGFTSKFNSMAGNPMFYQWYYPKASKIVPQQAAYIENWMYNFEEAVFSSNYRNNNNERYTDLIDLNSFVDFFLINELSKNSDGYKLSSYLHKQKDSNGGKLIAGPIWDFDQTYGMSTVCSNSDYNGWLFLQNQNGCVDLETMPMWWERMLEDTIFQNRLKCRWTSFLNTFLALDSINYWINDYVKLLSDPIDRNYKRWDEIIGHKIWFESDPIKQSYIEEVDYMKWWIGNRINWLDLNMPGNCNHDIVMSVPNTIINANDRYSIYPNPGSGVLNVRVNNNEEIQIQITSLTGQIVKSTSNRGNTRLNVSDLQNKIYIVSIKTKNKIQVFKYSHIK